MSARKVFSRLREGCGLKRKSNLTDGLLEKRKLFEKLAKLAAVSKTKNN